MDFTMDIDKFTYIIQNIQSVSDTLNQYISDYYGIIDELSSGLEGLAKEQYFNLALYWVSECNNLVKDIDDFKKTLSDNLPDAGELLNRGKKLSI